MPVRSTAALAAILALSGAAFAQQTLPDPGTRDGARQERMESAYADHLRQQDGGHPGPAARAEERVKAGAHEAGRTIRRDAHKTSATAKSDTHRAGEAIENGAHKTGAAIKSGAHKTGEAIENGAHKTGAAVRRGVDKLEGKPASAPST
jgi:hypothetical protein